MKETRIKEQEERSSIDQLLADWEKSGQKVCLIEHPVKSITLKELGQNANIPDAIVERDGNRMFVEVTTTSRNAQMRKEIAMERKGIIDTGNIPRGPFNLSGLELSTIDEILRILKQKANKHYTKFMMLSEVKKGILMIEFIFQDPFCDIDQWENLISVVGDEQVLYLCDVGASNFDEIYVCAYVQTDRGWEHQVYCIADQTKCNFLKDRFKRMKPLKEQLKVQKEI